MAYVFTAFLNVYCSPKSYNSLNELLFTFWLYFSPIILFEFMPKILDRVEIWGFGRGFPPIDRVVPHPVCSIAGRMFGVIVHLKFVPFGIDLLDEWQQRTLQDADKQLFLHNSFKNAYTTSSFLTKNINCTSLHLIYNMHVHVYRSRAYNFNNI